MTIETLFIFSLGVITWPSVAGLVSLYRNRKELPPVEGKTIVNKGGKQHYRRLPKRKGAANASAGA